MEQYSSQKVHGIRSGALFLIVFTSVLLGLRLWARFGILRTLGLDDILVLIAYVFSMICASVIIAMTFYGMGTHKENVSDEHYTMFLKLQLVASPMYSWGSALAKCSFAALYLRLLPVRNLQILNKGIIVFLICQAIEETLIPILRCDPVAKSWDLTIPANVGTCMSLVPLWWSTFAFNLITDLTLFMEPIPTMWRLQLPLVKRLGLIFMMSLGLLVTSISVIRMVYVQMIGADDTYQLADPLLWTCGEACAIICCSCVPSLRQVAAAIPGLNSALGLSSNRDTRPSYGRSGGGGKHGVSIQLRSHTGGGKSLASSSTHPQSIAKPPKMSSRFGMVSHAEALSSQEEIFPGRAGVAGAGGGGANDSSGKGAIMVTHQVTHDVESQSDTDVNDDDDGGHQGPGMLARHLGHTRGGGESESSSSQTSLEKLAGAMTGGASLGKDRYLP